jgi:hypothetical protein
MWKACSMTEGVLEQIVDDYLQFDGFFTTHNVRSRPRPDDLEYVAAENVVPSDVDVVGLQPNTGLKRLLEAQAEG